MIPFTIRLLLIAIVGAGQLACGKPAPKAAEGAAFLPPVGLAVMDTAHTWCATFADDSLRPGARVAIVFPDSGAVVAARRASIVRRRAQACPAAFPQPAFEDMAAYDLALLDAVSREAAEARSVTPPVALAVATTATWRRASDGVVRADVDGDGRPEEARVCQADEGQHFTLWSADARGRRRRWHGYYDWGAFVEVTCSPEEHV